MSAPALPVPPALARFLPFGAAALGVGALALMDAFMKSAALGAGAYSATLLRSFVGAAIIAPFWLCARPSWPSRSVMKLHVERGIVSALMALSFFYALTTMPLADAIAISFVAPIVALYFAHVFLGEAIRQSAIFASLLGFCGMLVIVGGQAGLGGAGAAEITPELGSGLAALAFSALLYAYNFVVIRRQSQVAKPVEIATFHSGIGGLVLLSAAPFAFVAPAPATWLAIAAAGALTVIGAMLIAWAYARAQAQALVPIEYTGFLWASVLGWLFFSETVTIPTMIGAAIILSGAWLATRSAE